MATFLTSHSWHRAWVISVVLIGAGSVPAQTTAQSTPKRAAPKSSSPQPAAAATPAASSSALAPKGFARVDVTPQYKDEFEHETRVAVIVSPSYLNSGLPTLRYTPADAVELRAELERQGYTVMVIQNTEASKDNILQKLQDSKQLLSGTTQSTFVFAFSGHGFAKDGKNFLMPYGVSADHPEEEGLPLEKIEELMTQSGARRKVVLVDACRAVPEAKSADSQRSFTQFGEAEGFSILLSTAPGGFSYEDSDLKHGIFTWYLLEGLRGKAAGKDGYVTFYDLQKYVEKSVLAYSLKKDHIQKPFTSGERNGDFLLATAAPPKPEEIQQPSAASELSSDSQLLRDVGTNRSFFSMLRGKDFTLFDAKTLAPFVDVTEKEVKTPAESYRYFEGTGPNRELIDVAVSLKGEEVLGAKGRIGTPCPGDNPCSTGSELPLLPGEKRDENTDKASKLKNGGTAISGGLKKLGLSKGADKADKTSIGADTAGKTADSVNPLLKYKWKPFDLTTNLPKQAQAQVQR